MSEVYRGLLPDFFDQPLEPERRATCNACAMCSPQDPTGSGLSRFFHPDVKCCSYHPTLPNYQLGALLADDRPALEEGRRRVRALIERQHGVAPRGIGPSPSYRLLYHQLASEGQFGLSRRMLCPLFVSSSGSCSVWPYREAQCSTYFCKHDHGADGQAFWKQLKQYQVELQETLITYALLELDWDVDQLSPAEHQITAEELDGEAPDARTWAALWGQWAGREEQLYVKTFEIVRRLTAADLERIGGVRLQVELKRLARCYERMTHPEIRPVLKRNPTLQVSRDPGGRYVLVGYSKLNPSRVSRAVMDAVDAFDGHRPTEEVLAALRSERRPVPSQNLVRSLYHHRILIDGDDPFGK